MSTDTPAALASEVAETTVESRSGTAAWVETALTVAFTAAAVLFVSFLAVVTGLV
jgi:xanthine/uracil/vitamin C permease (AzgA family)